MNQTKNNPKRNLPETFFVTGIWFLLTLYIALPQGLKTRIGVINIANNSSPELIRKAWGPGDAGSLLDTAITWSKFHQIDRTTQFWIVHLWTPGMSIIEIPLIWLSKLGLPIFWTLLFITLIVWSTVFWFTWRFISPIIGRLPCVFVAAILVASLDFRYIFREDLFYTEGLSFGFLMLGIGFITWEYLLGSSRLYPYVIGGVLIGTSIMIRYVSDIGVLILFVVATTLLFLQLRGSIFSRALSNKSKSKTNRKNPKAKDRVTTFFEFLWFAKSLRIFGVWISCAIAFLFTLPWRIASHFIFDGPFFTLSGASGLVGPLLWLPTSKLGFWKFSGMNWSCVIDPIKCAALNQSGKTIGSSSSLLKAGVFTAIRHPLAFLSTRWHFLELQWIPRDGISGMGYVLENIFSVIPILLLGVGVILLIRNPMSTRASWIWVPLLMAEIGQLLIVHYESRYFIPVRLFALGFFIFTLLGERTSRLNDRT